VGPMGPAGGGGTMALSDCPIYDVASVDILHKLVLKSHNSDVFSLFQNFTHAGTNHATRFW
jgi:hypothetical protein